MKAFFATCSDAIDKAVKEKSFGLYYSETSRPNVDVHVHDCCEIFLSLSDANGFLIDDKFYKVSENDLFLLNNFQAHKVNPFIGKKFVRYSLHVHPDFLYANSMGDVRLTKYFYAVDKPDVIKLTNDERDELVKLFKSLTVDYGYADDIYKRLRAIEIVLQTINLCDKHVKAQPHLNQDAPLNSALKFINENFTNQITLQDVAKNSFLSVNRLCGLFKEYLSTTVIKYVTSKRISYAKKLLAEGKNVTQTAFESGFNDYANFIRTFKKTVGISPGKYREETKR